MAQNPLRAPDWRWLRDRADSPWYPTMRLFRQTTRGDWNGVFVRMAEVLESELDEKSQRKQKDL